MYSFDDLQVLGHDCPIGQVEGKVALVVAPLRPNGLVFFQPFEDECFCFFILFMRDPCFLQAQQNDAKVPGLHQWVGIRVQLGRPWQLFHDLRPWLALGHHAGCDDALAICPLQGVA